MSSSAGHQFGLRFWCFLELCILSILLADYADVGHALVLKNAVQGEGVNATSDNTSASASSTSNASSSSSSSSCDASDFQGTFDLVITWHTSSPQSLFLQKSGADNSTNKAMQQIENQREITYLLRGAEKYGMMAFVRNVYVVVNSKELDAYGPPRDLDFSLPNLHLIRDTDIGVSPQANGYLAKIAGFSRIPGIGDWFFHVMDDVFPVNQFHLSAIYDSVHKRPYVRMGVDSFIFGWCDGGRATMTHGPWFVNTCRLRQLEARYDFRFAHTRNVNRYSENDKSCADARCLYDNWNSNTGWATYSADSSFLKICHTNGHCSSYSIRNPTAMFLNLQGPGMSDDYGSNYAIKAAAMAMLQDKFSEPSRFEYKGPKRGTSTYTGEVHR